MESFLLRIAVVAGEAVIGGIALGAILMVIRRVQLALGMRDRKAATTAHS